MKGRLFIIILLIHLSCAARAGIGISGSGSPGRRDLHGSRIENMALVQTAARTFYIDRYEVSELRQNDFFSVASQIPRTAVSRQDAAAICERQEKSLCTLSEWRNACLGIHRRQFSYANRLERGRCNTSGRQIEITGWKEDCRADGDVHDMVGNVMEWVSDNSAGIAAAAGGSHSSGDESDCFTTYYFSPETKNDQIGFRCCL